MSTIAATTASASKPFYHSLFVQVLVALLLGIVLGMAAPDFAVGLKIFSDAFLKLISMIVAPIVFCVVVLSVDWFIGMARALGNLIGNCVATVVVAAWEGDLDRAKAARVLAGEELVDVTAG